MRNYSKALIIDDDVDLCMLLKDILGKTIPIVDCAGSIEEGRKMLGEQKPDIIFLDNNLPDGQGLSLIKEIKTTSPVTLVVLISAMDESVYKSADCRPDLFIGKPLTLININEAITNYQKRTAA